MKVTKTIQYIKIAILCGALQCIVEKLEEVLILNKVVKGKLKFHANGFISEADKLLNPVLGGDEKSQLEGLALADKYVNAYEEIAGEVYQIAENE